MLYFLSLFGTIHASATDDLPIYNTICGDFDLLFKLLFKLLLTFNNEPLLPTRDNFEFSIEYLVYGELINLCLFGDRKALSPFISF